MQNVILFGMTDLAEVLAYHLENDERYNIYAITVDKEYLALEKNMCEREKTEQISNYSI